MPVLHFLQSTNWKTIKMIIGKKYMPQKFKNGSCLCWLFLRLKYINSIWISYGRLTILLFISLYNSIVLDVRPNPRLTSPPQIKKQCHNGKRMVCTTKYHTECTTQQIQQTMEEDHPKCQVEMVEKCPEDSNR